MKRPWMPLYIADYLKKTTHLGALESGAYLHLIMDYWQNDGLPGDDRQLARIAKLTDREWRASKATLQAFFHDGWKHERIDEEIAHASEVSEKRKKAVAIRDQNKHKDNITSGSNDPSVDDTLHKERKKDAAGAALTVVPEIAPAELERAYFDRGKQLLGKSSGGMLVNLLKAKGGNIALARAALEQASTKSDAREYIGRIISGPKTANEPNWLDGIPGVL